MLLADGDNAVAVLERLINAGWYREAGKLGDQALREGLIGGEAHAQVTHALALLQARHPERDFPGHEVFGVAEGSIVSSLQFRPLSDYRQMQAAFKQGVDWIEIEPSSQCNRACHYCPNSAGHRRTDNAFMDPEVFVRLVSNLQEIDYAGTIVLVGQNEFFMHEKNFEYLAHIRNCLPRATIRLFSNGDYATRENIDLARHCGVKELIVTLHASPGKAYDAAYVIGRVEQFRKRTGIAMTLEAFEKDERLNFTADVDGMKLTIGAINFDRLGHNWAGQLDFKDSAPRSSPCSYPLRQFVVNHAGDIFLCCVVPRDDNAENRELGTVVGNLADHPSLFHAYASEPMRKWREATFATRDLPKPCDTCTGHEGIDESRFAALAGHVEASRKAAAA